MSNIYTRKFEESYPSGVLFSTNIGKGDVNSFPTPGYAAYCWNNAGSTIVKVPRTCIHEEHNRDYSRFPWEQRVVGNTEQELQAAFMKRVDRMIEKFGTHLAFVLSVRKECGSVVQVSGEAALESIFSLSCIVYNEIGP